MELINLHDYEALARQRLPHAVWDTYAQGSEDEQTLHDNERAYADLRLRPRVLVDTRQCDTTTTVLGSTIVLPVMLAPVSLHRMVHPDGEKATARAAQAAGTTLVASTLSSYPLEDIAQAADGSPLWFQLYLYKDEEFNRHLLRRVELAGYRAVVLTVDAPFVGNRERDRRNHFTLPEAHPFGNFTGNGASLDINWQNRGDRQMLTWQSIAQVRSLTSLPLLLKGVLTAEDAVRAVAAGIDGIIVSNHGGRQLDTSVATIEALPEVVSAASGRCEVYVDGGIRRGTDILKALALGARAVLIGRPAIWGLAADGAAGVQGVLQVLHDELTLAMRLAGRPSIADIDGTLVQGACLPQTRPVLIDTVRQFADKALDESDKPPMIPQKEFVVPAATNGQKVETHQKIGFGRRLLGNKAARALLLGLIFSPVLLGFGNMPSVINGFTTHTFISGPEHAMTYYLHVPDGAGSSPQRFPLVVMLQGGGERGLSSNTFNDNRALMLNNMYINIWSSSAVQQQWPSFIVAPQLMDTEQWVNVPSSQGSYTMASQPTVELQMAKDLIETLKQQYPAIDPGRVYITGPSMGGYGVWDAIERWPQSFAAAAPIAAGGSPAEANRVISLPIWVFHSADDNEVPVSGSRDMVQAIRQAGGNPRYTEYPHGGHGVWMNAYQSPDFLAWFFAQRTSYTS
ncbi:MAG TPA: alpha-hydroxy-acid oxidizing protein [Ktedonobacterales bacterium]|nr:alpha-hydroxy-acid oxidizing protein [Ktedonobacterales bacterium]